MGTRHLVCVFADGEFKIAQYGQFDGYPSGAGIDVVQFIQEVQQKYLAGENAWNNFKEKISALPIATPEQLKYAYRSVGIGDDGRASMEQSDALRQKYPQLHRATSTDLLDLILEDDFRVTFLPPPSTEFAGDSLFCEWAYVINLDDMILEVYKGFNEAPLPPWERFAFLNGNAKSIRYFRDEPYIYEPIRLLDWVLLSEVSETWMDEDRLERTRYSKSCLSWVLYRAARLIRDGLPEQKAWSALNFSPTKEDRAEVEAVVENWRMRE